jgi:hypothetical protein
MQRSSNHFASIFDVCIFKCKRTPIHLECVHLEHDIIIFMMPTLPVFCAVIYDAISTSDHVVCKWVNWKRSGSGHGLIDVKSQNLPVERTKTTKNLVQNSWFLCSNLDQRPPTKQECYLLLDVHVQIVNNL